MTRRASRIAIGVALAALAGCAAPSETPEDVARGFWAAIEARDLETARSLSSAPSQRRLDALFGDRLIEAMSFGETLRNERSAVVETSMRRPGASPPIAFDTHLVQLDGAWRVDAEQTAADLRQATFATAIDEVKESLREGQRVMSEVLEQGAREASEALRRAIEEMEDALGGPPPSP